MRKKRWAIKSKGDVGAGNLYVIVILLILAFMGFALIGGGLPQTKSTSTNNTVIILSPSPETVKDNVQLRTFGYITPIPTH